MTKVDIVFAIILLVAAVFLTIAVLMQSGKSHNLSGTIAGGADTFFGKTKGKTIDRVLSKLTTVVAIVFALLVIVVYVIQDDNVVTKDNYIDDYINSIDETALRLPQQRISQRPPLPRQALSTQQIPPQPSNQAVKSNHL